MGRALVEGAASGPVMGIPPLSFWGGLDPFTGRIVDRSHPALGQTLSGRVLVMSMSRGSSSSSSVLGEAIRLGTAPAAIVLSEPDAILSVGSIVAELLYGRTCPLAVVSAQEHTVLARAGFADLVSHGGRAVLTLRS